MGQILAALDRHGLNERTLVIFTSDNGPWLSYGDHAGSAGPSARREGDDVWEGGVREPCVMRWTGKIPAGTTCTELAATIDILPTFAALAGAAVSSDRIIDGKDIRPLHLRRTRSEVSARSLLLLLEHRPGGDPQRALEAPFPAHVPQPEGERRHRRQAGPYVERTTAWPSTIWRMTSAKRRTSRRNISDVVARLEKLARGRPRRPGRLAHQVGRAKTSARRGNCDCRQR